MPVSISLRFSRRQAQLIGIGLAHIVGADIIYQQSSQLPHHSRADLRWLPPSFDRGEFHHAVMAEIHELNARVRHLAGRGGRLSLHTFQLASCALALRFAGTRLRHKHFGKWFAALDIAYARLLRKLENARRRGRRRFIAEFGRDAYITAQGRWQRHARWMRVHYACGCRHTKITGLRHYYRMVVTSLMEPARCGLRRRGVEPPPEPVLRRLVRGALARTRRDREGFGVATLIQDKSCAESYLSDFVIRHLQASDLSQT